MNTHVGVPFFILGLYIIEHIFHHGNNCLQTMMIAEMICTLTALFFSSSCELGTKQVAQHCRDKRKLIEYVHVPSDCEISSLGRIQHAESENPPASLHGGVN